MSISQETLSDALAIGQEMIQEIHLGERWRESTISHISMGLRGFRPLISVIIKTPAPRLMHSFLYFDTSEESLRSIERQKITVKPQFIPLYHRVRDRLKGDGKRMIEQDRLSISGKTVMLHRAGKKTCLIQCNEIPGTTALLYHDPEIFRCYHPDLSKITFKPRQKIEHITYENHSAHAQIEMIARMRMNPQNILPPPNHLRDQEGKTRTTLERFSLIQRGNAVVLVQTTEAYLHRGHWTARNIFRPLAATPLKTFLKKSYKNIPSELKNSE